MRIGINGFGRIGRVLARILWQLGRHEVVCVNDLHSDYANWAYLLRHDSNYGPFPAAVQVSRETSTITVSSTDRQWSIACHSIATIDRVPWHERGCELIIEATGQPTNHDAARQLLRTVGPVVIGQCTASADTTVVHGLNLDTLTPRAAAIIAASTCDANAIAPVLAALQDLCGIDHAMITTLHPWLSNQNLTDGYLPTGPQSAASLGDYAMGRSAIGALIPKTTSTGQALTKLLPSLAGRLTAVSFRTPTPLVSYADLSIRLARTASLDEITTALARLQPVIAMSDEPLVSTDLIASPAAATLDRRWLNLTDGHWLKLVLAYDNEWGYCHQLHALIDHWSSAPAD